MKDRENSFRKLWDIAVNFYKLNLQELKLTAAEKVTVLVSAAAVTLLLGMLSLLIVIFLSFAAVEWLSTVIHPGWAYVIMAGIYIVIGIVVFMMRKPLIINPVARFLSRLFLM